MFNKLIVIAVLGFAGLCLRSRRHLHRQGYRSPNEFELQLAQEAA